VRSPPDNRWAEVIGMGVLEFSLILSAVTFVVSVWVYAHLLPTTPRFEKALSFVWVASLLVMAAVSTIIALAHI
jgi:hypothetical protein